MRTLEEHVDWTYDIPEDVNENLHIKILSGEFADTVYQYGSVSVEEEKNGDVFLKFIYNVRESPLDKDGLEKSMDFKNFIGDILVNIMTEKIEKGLKDETRTNDFEKSDLQ